MVLSAPRTPPANADRSIAAGPTADGPPPPRRRTRTVPPCPSYPTITTGDAGDDHALADHVRSLARAVLEVRWGVRPVEHLTRWIDRHLYVQLELESSLAREDRRARRLPLHRPTVAVGHPHLQQLPDLVEAVAVVHTRDRARALALTLRRHPRSGRWVLVKFAVL